MAKKPTKKELAAQEAAAKEAAAKAETEAAAQQEAQAQQGPMLSVLAQYTKDQSFENPNAPDSLRSGLAAPEIQIGIEIGRQMLEGDEMTQNGGYPPIMLEPPDFAAMFRDEMMRRAADAPTN